MIDRFEKEWKRNEWIGRVFACLFIPFFCVTAISVFGTFCFVIWLIFHIVSSPNFSRLLGYE